jgi:hypothetical protein
MSAAAPSIMDFGRIVLNFYLLLFGSITKTGGVDISFLLVIMKHKKSLLCPIKHSTEMTENTVIARIFFLLADLIKLVQYLLKCGRSMVLALETTNGQQKDSGGG